MTEGNRRRIVGYEPSGEPIYGSELKEEFKEEKEKKEEIPVGTIAAIAIAGGGVVGAVWLGYKYFVEPGNLILGEYRYILEDIYKETKKFLEDNAKLDPPIYGLTSSQEAIISAKEKRAEYVRPIAEKVLAQRSIDPTVWFAEIIIGIFLVLGTPYVVSKVIDMIKRWRQTDAATRIQSSHGHTHLLFEIITNEMALVGKLNIASGFLTTIEHYYQAYTTSAINTQIVYYNVLIPTLPPGIEFMVATSMLNYFTFEISAAGIMGSLWSFWLPPII